jgi:hypothetical protein
MNSSTVRRGTRCRSATTCARPVVSLVTNTAPRMAGVLAGMLPLRLALSDAWRQASPADSGPGTEHTERGPCAGSTRDYAAERATAGPCRRSLADPAFVRSDA